MIPRYTGYCWMMAGICFGMAWADMPAINAVWSIVFGLLILFVSGPIADWILRHSPDE